MLITSIDDLYQDFKTLPVSEYWTEDDLKPYKMHKIHWYPAKFPPFLVTKAINYAQKKNINIELIVDYFCGCGTTPLEAKRLGYNFWGCDINPVATLIAKAKSNKYSIHTLNRYYRQVLAFYDLSEINTPSSYLANERLLYWHSEEQIKDLYKLLYSIQNNVSEGKYLDFFLVAFSNILRNSSRWLMKSIKPQVDKEKKCLPVIFLFNRQIKIMFDAVKEINTELQENIDIVIDNTDFLERNIPFEQADMVITSPPYVTSYEYADLHQLSTLWFKFAEDYRTLRKGTIGSVYNMDPAIDYSKKINKIGKNILIDVNKKCKRNTKSIAKYFYDIKKTVEQTNKLLKKDSLAFFIIGNTQYSGVCIDNAKYTVNCLLDQNFCEIELYKRNIGSKILTRYRDKYGKFTTNRRAKKIYHEEFVIIAKK